MIVSDVESLPAADRTTVAHDVGTPKWAVVGAEASAVPTPQRDLVASKVFDLESLPATDRSAVAPDGGALVGAPQAVAAALDPVGRGAGGAGVATDGLEPFPSADPTTVAFDRAALVGAE